MHKNYSQALRLSTKAELRRENTKNADSSPSHLQEPVKHILLYCCFLTVGKAKSRFHSRYRLTALPFFRHRSYGTFLLSRELSTPGAARPLPHLYSSLSFPSPDRFSPLFIQLHQCPLLLFSTPSLLTQFCSSVICPSPSFLLGPPPISTHTASLASLFFSPFMRVCLDF